jgi:hypothetical protein
MYVRTHCTRYRHDQRISRACMPSKSCVERTILTSLADQPRTPWAGPQTEQAGVWPKASGGATSPTTEHLRSSFPGHFSTIFYREIHRFGVLKLLLRSAQTIGRALRVFWGKLVVQLNVDFRTRFGPVYCDGKFWPSLTPPTCSVCDPGGGESALGVTAADMEATVRFHRCEFSPFERTWPWATGSYVLEVCRTIRVLPRRFSRTRKQGCVALA